MLAAGLVMVTAAGVLAGQRTLDGGVPTGPPLVTSYPGAMVTAPPSELGLDPFYEKFADALGIPVVASGVVDDAAVLLARDIVNGMLGKRPDIRAALVERGSRLMIIGREQGQLDLPEYRDWTKPAFDDRRLTQGERNRYYQPGGIAGMTDAEYWNGRARGMGGVRTSCGEENLLGLPGTRYFGEHICVHEFSHGIMSAIRAADPGLYQEIEDAYRVAMDQGLYGRSYAANTVAEYWAEGTQWWFWSNYPWYDETRDPVFELWSPDQLRDYDPALYAILEQVYPGHRIPADIYHGKDLRGRRRY